MDIEDFTALEAYLRQRRAGPIDLRILSGGVSNRVVLVNFPDGSGWVIKQALEKLRVAVDWHCSTERIHREALALSLLERLVPRENIAPLVFEDRAESLLAMQAVPQPHTNWKQDLMARQIDPQFFDQAGRLLGAIHREGASLEESAARELADRRFFHALRVEPYYLYTAEQLPTAAAFLSALVEEMNSLAITFVHGDFSPKNLLVYRNHLVLLDHEVAHLGDPAFDLGFFLAHLLSKAHHIEAHRREFLDGALAFWNSYQDAFRLESRAVRHTLGCLLARVAGRSPLEYLDSTERERQQRAVLSLISAPPSTIRALTEEFPARL